MTNQPAGGEFSKVDKIGLLLDCDAWSLAFYTNGALLPGAFTNDLSSGMQTAAIDDGPIEIVVQLGKYDGQVTMNLAAAFPATAATTTATASGGGGSFWYTTDEDMAISGDGSVVD